MGSQCSTCWRGKRNEDQCNKTDEDKHEAGTMNRTDDVKCPPLQSRSTLEAAGGAVKRTMENGILRSEAENLGCIDKRCALPHEDTEEMITQRPRPCEAGERASAITEEKEAKWVDSNRAELIQNAPVVMAIADQMLQQGIIHNERYSIIKSASTPQDQMRELYGALTTAKVKSAFFRILNPPTEDVIKEAMNKHKAYLREKCMYELEGAEEDRTEEKSLDRIYTELHIIRGESDNVNTEHEIWDIEGKARSQTFETRKVHCNDIFKGAPEGNASFGRNGGAVRAIRTVMTKGIAGIGKTVSVKKFILDWADGKANQDLDFIFYLPFRELNLVKDDQFSLETLVKAFHPELTTTAVARIFDNHKVLFIFDGLDESQLQLDFKTKLLTDATKESSVDILVTNLIREHLLPSALIWITSRPGAVQRIPRKHIFQWTEVRGFTDEQKVQYFSRRVEDKGLAEEIIKCVTLSRSLFIMCHIPIFCWIVVKVLVYLLPKRDNSQDGNIKIPTTLTELYTHFLYIQMCVTTEKYESQSESDEEEALKSNEEFILKLGRMAFEFLNEGNIIFTSSDLKNYGIDIKKTGIYCGLCTEILKEEGMFNRKKLYCFVHLTVQEYFAALFVYRSFASKTIDSPSLKNFLIIGSDEEVESLLDSSPVDLSLEKLMEISIANSTLRKTGELDMFLRFLIGMSLQSTQKLLRGLIQQQERHSEVVEEIRKSLREIDFLDCSPDRCLNLVHCLKELKDNSLHETVQCYVRPNPNPETQLSPAECSALADSILMSDTTLDEFNLKKYRPSTKGIFRLVPAVRNCRKARISGVFLDSWLCETISSALRMPNSVLNELHLMHIKFTEQGIKILTDGLVNSHCKLEHLSLSGHTYSYKECECLASTIISLLSNLRELELSGNVLGVSLCSVLTAGLSSPKLEKLRLNRNSWTADICTELTAAFTSSQCYLRELELSYAGLEDSHVEKLSTGLMNINCTLEILSLSHNRLTEKGCGTLASVLSSRMSRLTELDLSYNDLQDSGVSVLCSALKNPHCGLQTLRLSFCKVTRDGCAALASALKSDHCRLSELDLSFNHLTDEGVEVLRDSCSCLQKLNVDHNEEFWFDLKLLRQYACDVTLDPNTAAYNVTLTEGNKTATYVNENQPYPDHPDRFLDSPQVLCEEVLSGRHYWEAECVSADVGVAYKSIDREADCLSDTSLGENEKSWCWEHESSFRHNDSYLNFADRGKRRGTVGVYLDWPAGILSFFEVLPDTLVHLYTVCTTFTEPLCPGFKLSDFTGSQARITPVPAPDTCPDRPEQLQ